MRLSTLLLLAASSLTFAKIPAGEVEARAPAPTAGPDFALEKRAVSCPAVKSKVRAAKQQAQATRYCKSVYGGTSTSTATVSPTACVAPGSGAAKREAAAEAASPIVIEKRAVKKPSSLSSYNGARLKQACACLGVTGGGTTTVTVTSGTPPAPSTAFKMLASSNGKYGVLNIGTQDISFNGATRGSGSTFHLNSGSLTVDGGIVSARVPHAADDDNPDFVSFNIETSPAVLSCSINPKSDGTCPMTCTSFGSVNSFCDSTDSNEWFSGTRVGTGCVGFTPYAVTP